MGSRSLPGVTQGLPMPGPHEFRLMLTDGLGDHRLAVGAGVQVMSRPQAPQTNHIGDPTQTYR